MSYIPGGCGGSTGGGGGVCAIVRVGLCAYKKNPPAVGARGSGAIFAGVLGPTLPHKTRVKCTYKIRLAIVN